MIVHLYGSHVKINDSADKIQFTQINEFISAINTLTIPTGIPFSDSLYRNGALEITLIDHRFSPNPTHNPNSNSNSNSDSDSIPILKTLLLNPTQISTEVDILALLMASNPDKEIIDTEIDTEIDTAERLVEAIHSKILPLIKTLNLDQSPDIFKQESLRNYNAKKYLHSSNPVPKKLKLQKSGEYLLPPPTTFYPSFSQSTFIDDWRAKAAKADTEALIGLGDTNKLKLSTSGARVKKLIYNMNQYYILTSRITRTLRFESKVNQNTIYTILNGYSILNLVYQVYNDSFIGVLRWGTQDGLSINGQTIRFEIGNAEGVEYYVAHFKGFYGLLHLLQSDSAEQL